MSGPPKILLVEDQVLIAVGLTEVLNQTGHEVVGVAATVSDALSVAAQHETGCSYHAISTGFGSLAAVDKPHKR